MSLETNKVAAAVLLAGIVTLTAAKLSGVLYHPEQPEKRGYTIAGAEDDAGGSEDAGKKAGPVDILAFMGEADLAKGEKIFKTKCATCHTGEKGGADKQGPNLWAIVGQPKGARGGFAYSSALKEKGGDWDFQALSEFFNKPAKYIKGTRMAFAGLKKPADRASLITYLNSLGSNKPVPAYTPPPEADAAKVTAEDAPSTEVPAAELP